MRYAYLAIVIICSCTESWACSADTVRPGISLDEARARLEKYGYEVSAAKFGMAAIAGDPNHELEYCRIDADFTLIIVYDSSTEQIHSLELLVLPGKPMPKADRVEVSRDVLEFTPENGGIYTLKLARLEESKNGSQ